MYMHKGEAKLVVVVKASCEVPIDIQFDTPSWPIFNKRLSNSILKIHKTIVSKINLIEYNS